MEQAQEEFVALFTRGAVRPEALTAANKDKVILAKDDERVRTLRGAELSKSIAVVEAAKQELADALAMQFEVNGEKTTTRDALGQQENAFDTEESRHITSSQANDGAYKKAVKRANNKFAPLAAESARLRELTVKRHVYEGEGDTKALVEQPVPLFDERTLTKEFWTPLVREQIVPETFVPPKYSATQQMIDGSNDYYIQECKEKGKEPELGLASFGKDVVNAAAAAATGGFPSGSDINLIIEGTALAIGTTIDGAQFAKESVKSRTFDVNSFTDIGNSVGAAVGKIASGVLGNDNQGDAYGQMVTAGFRAFGFGARFAKYAKEPSKPFPWDELVGDVLSSVSAGLTEKSDTSSDTGVSDTAGIESAGIAAFGSVLKSGVTNLKGLKWDSDPKVWAKAITKVMVSAAAAAAKADISAQNTIAENAMDNPTNTDFTEANKQADREATLVDAGEAMAEVGIDQLVDATFDKFHEEQQAEDQKEIEDAQALIEKEKADYKNALDRLGAMESDEPSQDDFKSIAKMIEKMKNDRKILQVATMLATATVEVVSHFVAPLKAANSLIQFMLNTQAAIERGEALLNWLDSSEEALVSVSPYATSIKNFVKNQGDQLTHHSLQAALHGLEAVSAAAECGFPPAKAITASLSAAVLLENAVYTLYKEQQLKSAWKTTKKALDNPENRKLGLIARKMNPTLAKYTIAYGAVIEKDSVAIAAMSRCGLDRETLSRAKGNVPLVKEFLQELYVEDGVLLGPIPQGPGKTPMPKPSLTVKSWALTVELWKAEHKLSGDPPSTVRLQLAELEQLKGIDLDALEPEDQKTTLESLATSAGALETALNGYEPKDSTMLDIKGASTVLDAYADLAGSLAELSQQAAEALAEAP